MVAIVGLGLFIAGMALIAIELGYPRRYLGVIGLDALVVGLLLMFLPPTTSWPVQAGLAAAVAGLTAALAIPFYRRYAPHVGPMVLPQVGAGDLATVVDPIPAGGQGLVRAGGLVWAARSDTQIPFGATVRILVIESDQLWVEPELDAAPDPRDTR